jgi:quercetin dioxygenase-like cupin family protein
MRAIHFREADDYEPEQDWRRVRRCNAATISVEYSTKPPHHSSAVHDHPSEQVCIVIEGMMMVRASDGHEEILGEGHAASLAASKPRQVTNLLDMRSIGIDILCPGRPFDFWLRRKGAK